MDKPIAYVSLAMGRWYLAVAGMTLAVETDPCRDGRFPENKWTEETLKSAMTHINTEYNQRVEKLNKTISDLGWQLSPDRMGS